jgi:hypothetical protein
VKADDLAAYEYDFGDGWEHELVVEASAVADAATVYPACIAGEGACVWAGEDYGPAHFDLAAATMAAGSI